MRFKIKKSNITMHSLMIGIFCYFSYYFIRNSYLFDIPKFPNISTAALYLGLFFIVVSILTDSVTTFKQLIVILLLILLSFFVSRNIDDSFTFVAIVLFMIAGKNKKPENIYKFSFGVNMIWLICIIGCSMLGIIENKVISTLSHPNREYLGFTAPNAGHLLFFCILLFISYKKDTIKKRQLILFLVFTVWVYIRTDTLAAFFYSLIALLLSYFSKIIPEKFWQSRHLLNLFYIVIPLCVVVSFILPILYLKNNSFAIALNLLTSTRIELSARALQTYGITLFGQLISFNYTLSSTFDASQPYFYVDGSYLKYILMYGVVFVIFVLFLYHKMIAYSIKKKDFYIVISAFCALTFFIWNPQMLYVSYNPFLISLLYYYTASKKKN